AQVLDGLEVLGRLAVAHEERVLLDTGVHRDADSFLGDHGGPGGADGEHLQQAVARSSADEHVVRTLAQGDGNGDHASAATTCSTTSSIVSSSTSSTMSATSVYIGSRALDSRASSEP